MAAVLIGNTYVGLSSEDPGAVGYGYFFDQSDTGLLFKRNSDNSGWTAWGDSNAPLGGALLLAGGTMTGAILGAHGLMPLSGGDFTEMPTVNGDALTTQAYVDSQFSTVLSRMNTYVSQVIAALPINDLPSNIAAYHKMTSIAENTLCGTGMAIDLPTFADGTTATSAQVKDYGWALLGFPDGIAAGAEWKVDETSAGSMVIKGNWSTSATDNWHILTWAWAVR